MIVRPKPTFWDVLFTLKGSIAKAIAIRLIVITLLATAITLLSFRHRALFESFSAGPFTLIGLSLSIFMSFRNNACYERWWEGRKQWGSIIAEVRSLIRETGNLVGDPDRARLLRGTGGFVFALAAQLRERDPRAAACTFLEPTCLPDQAPNIPDAALQESGRALDGLVARQLVNEGRYRAIEERLSHMSAAQVACERIKGTPLPFAYTLLLHRTAYLFCCLLPFGLANLLGWATPLITAIVSYTFFGLDALGDELEQPFGLDVNDLPLDAIVRVMERDIRAALGETDLPPPLEPVDFLLR